MAEWTGNPWDYDENAPCTWHAGCDGRTAIAGSYCPTHRDAFYAYLDTPLSLGLPEVSERASGAADISPEAVAARKAARAREAEAIAWVTAYTGLWGLPLDIRASAKWGTKYLHLTERQVEVLLAGKARDAAVVAIVATDPLTIWLKTQHGSGFLASVGDQARAGRPLSPRQREVAQRIMDEQHARPETSTGRVEAPAPVVEGIYRDPATQTIWKVVAAHHGNGHLYAQRLIVREGEKAGFEYDAGAIRRIRPEWRMTLEQAVEFGQLCGICCNCGRILTDDKSIKAGIGPVCARRFT